MMRHIREDIAELFREVQRRRDVAADARMTYPLRYLPRLLPEDFPEYKPKPTLRKTKASSDWRILGAYGGTSRDRDLREIHAQLCAELLRR